LEENTIVLYISDERYHPELESGINVNDPVIKINWSTSIKKLSEKDKSWRWLEL
jgi:dTDP-4-dehydrorhamnose 3,5-epimerase-like enzyme